MARPAAAAAHHHVYSDPDAYCAHPHIVALACGDWLLVFNRTVRRASILHPPQDPLYCNVLSRSSDQGETWSTPHVVPGHDWHGVECAGLTVLAGDAVLLNQWRFAWYAEDRAAEGAPGLRTAHELRAEREQSAEFGGPAGDDAIAWQRANGGTYAHLSADGGRSWDRTSEIDTAPFTGGYGMRGGVGLADGEIVLPLCDVPQYERVFIVRSTDGGRSWSAPSVVADRPGKAFEEPAPLLLDDGRILMLLRENRSGRLHQTSSDDGGDSWSEPSPLRFAGYPADLMRLRDGRILCVAAERRPSPRICAVASNDNGMSWQSDHVSIVRDGLRNGDIGYPSSVLREDGDIYTVYYCQDERGITGIQATTYTI